MSSSETAAADSGLLLLTTYPGGVNSRLVSTASEPRRSAGARHRTRMTASLRASAEEQDRGGAAPGGWLFGNPHQLRVGGHSKTLSGASSVQKPLDLPQRSAWSVSCQSRTGPRPHSWEWWSATPTGVEEKRETRLPRRRQASSSISARRQLIRPSIVIAPPSDRPHQASRTGWPDRVQNAHATWASTRYASTDSSVEKLGVGQRSALGQIGEVARSAPPRARLDAWIAPCGQGCERGRESLVGCRESGGPVGAAAGAALAGQRVARPQPDHDQGHRQTKGRACHGCSDLAVWRASARQDCNRAVPTATVVAMARAAAGAVEVEPE